MKKIPLLIIAIIMIAGLALAQEQATITTPLTHLADEGLILKQGALLEWQGAIVKNLTSTTLAETQANSDWPAWVNMIWDGWTADVGWGYDASTAKIGALTLGREIGTLGKYLPIYFPLKDKIKITAYPIGLELKAKKNSDKWNWKGCSGGAFVKATIKI